MNILREETVVALTKVAEAAEAFESWAAARPTEVQQDFDPEEESRRQALIGEVTSVSRLQPELSGHDFAALAAEIALSDTRFPLGMMIVSEMIGGN